jgi:hypothetical protein
MDDERCKIEDEELDQLLPVPLENRNAFRSFVRLSVQELWRGLHVQREQVYRGPVVKGLNGYRKAIAKVKELLGDDGVEEALEHARVQVRAFLSGIRKADYADSLDNVLSFLDNLKVAIERAKSNVEKAYNEKGHRHGAQDGQIAIDLFLYQLIYFTKACGVKLLTSREPSAKRNSVHVTELLTKLKPYLPPEFPSAGLGGACEKAGIRVNAQLLRERREDEARRERTSAAEAALPHVLEKIERDNIRRCEESCLMARAVLGDEIWEEIFFNSIEGEKVEK